MNASTHEVRARQNATPVLAPATEPVPGLRIYMQPEELRTSAEDTYLWRIGHHSGLAIAKFETRRHAEAAVDVIADFTDWTRGADDLEADDELCCKTQESIDYRTAGKFLSKSGA